MAELGRWFLSYEKHKQQFQRAPVEEWMEGNGSMALQSSPNHELS